MNIGLADKNNRGALLILGAFAGLGGSIITAITAISAVWAIISVAIGRYRLSIDRSNLFLSLAALIYVLAAVLSAMVNLPGSPLTFGKTVLKLAPLALFLSPLFLVSRFRLSKTENILSSFILGAALCGILVLPLAAYQAFYMGARAEGGAGNAIPFAMICALFSTISLLNGEYPELYRKVLGWLGFACGAFAIVLSQTKGVMPVPLIGVAIYLVAFKMRDVGGMRVIMALFAVGLVALAAVYFSGAINRFHSISTVLGGEIPQSDNSYSLRFQLWQAALHMFSENPILGSGPQHIRDLIKTLGLSFSHFHNGFITALVGGGIVGLVALVVLLCTPLALCLAARSGPGGALRLYIAVMLTLTYMIGGLTNFIFGHDIYDSLFIFTACVCVASIGAGGGSAEEATTGLA